MKFLSNAIISFFELLEAEGRTLRKKAVHLSFVIVFFVIAGAVAILGCVLVMGGLFHFLANLFGRTMAYFISGAASLLIATALFKTGFYLASEKKSERDERKEEVMAHVEDRRTAAADHSEADSPAEKAQADAGGGQRKPADVDRRSPADARG